MEKRNTEYLKNKAISDSKKYSELCSQMPYYITTWLNAKGANCKLSTRLGYANDMITFLTYLKDVNPLLKNVSVREIPHDFIEQLSFHDINAYQTYLDGGIRSDGHLYQNMQRTRARRMSSLRSFFQFEYKGGMLPADPTANAEKIRLKKEKMIQRLDMQEVHSLVDAVENTSVKGRRKTFCEHTAYRDTAIIKLLLHTGVRISELVGLNLKDVDFESQCIYIIRKGGQPDQVFFNDDTAAALYDYIHLERSKYIEEGTKEDALFISSRGGRFSVRGIQVMLKKFGKDALPNYQGSLHPHTLRKTYGTALYDSTKDIRLVADVLGHDSITTTSKFYVDTGLSGKIAAGAKDVYDTNTDDE